MKTKIRLGIFGTIATLILLIALPSCQKTSEDFAMFIYDSSDTFIHSLSSKIIADVSGKYTYTESFAEKDQAIQNAQISQALESGKKLLLVNTVDRLACSAIIEKSKLYDANVIFFNREPLASDMAGQDKAYYVGSNANYEGTLQGQLAMRIFGSPSSLKF
jgi:methyl-galactoside transport system substrate-binding protein